MNPLLNLQPHEFCILFSKENNLNLLATQTKCEQLGVATAIEKGKKIFHYAFEKKLEENTVSEIEVKAWINSQGETIYFGNKRKKDYSNWKRLLYSGQNETIALALTMLNTEKRPQPKYFALWLALGSLHKNDSVRETGEMMALQYLTEEEWKMFRKSNLNSCIRNHVKKLKKFPSFIDTNYLQLWAEVFIGGTLIFSNRWLSLHTKGLDEFLKEPEFQEILKNKIGYHKKNKTPEGELEISQIELGFEKGEDLKYLKKFHQFYFKINALSLFREDTYQLSHKELAMFNSEYLVIKNFLLPKDEKKSLSLEEVKNVEWIFPEAIDFSDQFFPKIKRLDLLGTVVKQMDISKTGPQLDEMIICLKEQKTLPPCIYDCKKMKTLHIHDSIISQLDEDIKRLRRLEMVCMTGTRFEKFPVELFLLKKSDFIYDVNAPMNDFRLAEYKKLEKANRWVFSEESVGEFPYGLAEAPLNSLSFEKSEILEIDERILTFPTLSSLTFEEGKFEKMPDVLLKLKTLKNLIIRDNKVSTISFDWFLFANQQEVVIRLNGNPINHLPKIPLNFDATTIEKDRGQIILNINIIPTRQIEKYQSVFGEKFFG